MCCVSCGLRTAGERLVKSSWTRRKDRKVRSMTSQRHLGHDMSWHGMYLLSHTTCSNGHRRYLHRCLLLLDGILQAPICRAHCVR